MKDLDYGKNFFGLLKKLNHDMFSLKMLPICALRALQQSSKIYGRSGMWENGTLSVLAPLVLPISGKGSSSSHGLLPTPTAARYWTQTHPKTGKKTKSLEALAHSGELMLPTPSARDHKDTDAVKAHQSYLKRSSKNPNVGGMSLAAALGQFGSLPTPTTFDSGSPLPPRKKNKSGGQKPPLVSVIGGKLNPSFVEWMMGLPQGWTDPEPQGDQKKEEEKESNN